MIDEAHGAIPEAQVGFVGVACDEQTHEPFLYMESLPDKLNRRPVMVLDPMLATGGSMRYTIELLQRGGATNISVLCVVAASEGLAAVEEIAPDARVFTAAVDKGINKSAFIVPGLGDAGYRQFGPRTFTSVLPQQPIRRAAQRHKSVKTSGRRKVKGESPCSTSPSARYRKGAPPS